MIVKFIERVKIMSMSDEIDLRRVRSLIVGWAQRVHNSISARNEKKTQFYVICILKHRLG